MLLQRNTRAPVLSCRDGRGAAGPITSAWGLGHHQQHEASGGLAGHCHSVGGPGAR